ncbi:MAG TPA: chorismate synthase [Candidatus Thermoplasmatota archaeon]|nr:chorismate synthase [Candidatus Thermoplasmatota archaeon]
MNTIGRALRLTLFGESHGWGVGVVLDGVPAGLALDVAKDIQPDMDRRRPGQSLLTTQRQEADRVELLSGLTDGHTTGNPLTLVVRNEDKQSRVYDDTRFLPRPGHSDFPAYVKYGGQNDYRGGGQFSGRMTAGLVMAGAVAKKLLAPLGVEVRSHTVQIGDVRVERDVAWDELPGAEQNRVRCAVPEVAQRMEALVEAMRNDQDSVGGVVEGVARGAKVGWGEPFFGGVEACMAELLFSIPAVKGVDFGAGFRAPAMRGSQHNDPIAAEGGRIVTTTNHAGGILGGLTTGMPVVARVAFKPASSIARPQQTIDLRTLEPASLTTKGRHDPCIVPRAVPVVEACMAFTLADLAALSGELEASHGA